MIFVLAFMGGGLLGWVRAAKRGGTTGDRVQYALAHAIPCTLIALLIFIIGARLGVIE